MITSIEGKLTESTPVLAIININGISYEVNIPVTTAEKLPNNNNNVKLHTLVVYKEDSQTLFGFWTKNDRDFFRLLVEKVSGIGPKIALNILSRMSVSTLEGAIAQGDVSLLSKCPGIGKKTAERLIIELRDKIMPKSTAESPVQTDTQTDAPSSKSQDAVAALIALGYKAADADKAVRKALNNSSEDTSTEEIIKLAFSS